MARRKTGHVERGGASPETEAYFNGFNEIYLSDGLNTNSNIVGLELEGDYMEKIRKNRI